MPTIQKRSYNQNCALAKGLDVIGERWTFLIVRELLIGPKRYKDLLEGLVGMGTNLLATRLKTLVKSDVIEQVFLPPPAASRVYQLTDCGRQLEDVVLALVRWGFQFLGDKTPNALCHPEWDLVAMKAAFNAKRAEGLSLCCEWHVDGLTFYICVKEGTLEITFAPATKVQATATTDSETLLNMIRDKNNIKTALNKGKLTFTGSGLAVIRMIELFSLDEI